MDDEPAFTLHELIHYLWTKAVGLPGYDKREWKQLERRVLIECEIADTQRRERVAATEKRE